MEGLSAGAEPSYSFSNDIAEIGRLEQPQGTFGDALAKALAREQLGLGLAGQVGDVDDVLDDQRVDHVFDHAHEVGVESAEIAWLGGPAADEGLDLGIQIVEKLDRTAVAVAVA